LKIDGGPLSPEFAQRFPLILVTKQEGQEATFITVRHTEKPELSTRLDVERDAPDDDRLELIEEAAERLMDLAKLSLPANPTYEMRDRKGVVVGTYPSIELALRAMRFRNQESIKYAVYRMPDGAAMTAMARYKAKGIAPPSAEHQRRGGAANRERWKRIMSRR